MPERPAAPALQLTSPFAQILIACAALCALAVVLWHAETQAVGLSRLFGDAGIQTVSLDDPTPMPINDGRLVHAEGEARATLPVQDTDLDVIFNNTLVVERHVEMYQWHEVPNGPSYKYVTRWSSQWQDPARFRVPAPHTNPAFNLARQRFAATDAKLGAFRLPEETLATLEPREAYMPTETPRGWIRDANSFYLGLNPVKPKVGDLRVSWRILRAPAPVTILARQTPDDITSYEMRNGTNILMIRTGSYSPAGMLDAANPFLALSLWFWRALATAIFATAIFIITTQLRSLFLTRHEAARLTQASLLRLSVAGGLALSISIVSVAWLFRLPFESAAALLVCGAAFVVALNHRRHLLAEPLIPGTAQA
jgi:hypothetical protein